MATKDQIQQFFLDARDLAEDVAHSDVFTDAPEEAKHVREMRRLAEKLVRFTDQHYDEFVTTNPPDFSEFYREFIERD